MRHDITLIFVVAALITGGIIWLLPQPDAPPASPPASQLSVEQQQGLELVTSYCSDCHAVGKTGDSTHPLAPRFRELYLRYDVALLAEALVEGLYTHPDMPEFEFDVPQAESIITYLESLQPQ